MNTGRSFIIPKRGEASIDLIFYKPKKTNNNFIGVYNLVMNFTKLGFCVPIKNKTALECERALKLCLAFMAKHNVKVETIFSDFASEWKGEHMKFMEAMNIRQHHYAGLSSAPFIESFQNGQRAWLAKFMFKYSSERWVDAIPAFVEQYNKSVHSTIGTTPLRAVKMKPSALKLLRDRIVRKGKSRMKTPKLPKVKIGDKVRTAAIN